MNVGIWVTVLCAKLLNYSNFDYKIDHKPAEKIQALSPYRSIVFAGFQLSHFQSQYLRGNNVTVYYSALGLCLCSVAARDTVHVVYICFMCSPLYIYLTIFQYTVLEPSIDSELTNICKLSRFLLLGARSQIAVQWLSSWVNSYHIFWKFRQSLLELIHFRNLLR